jgi:hypothetical protein
MLLFIRQKSDKLRYLHYAVLSTLIFLDRSFLDLSVLRPKYVSVLFILSLRS